MKETFEDYLQRLKDRRTEDDYKYTDEDFKKYIHYIFDCYEKGMSVYKCLEFMYFAERDMDDQLFNRESKLESLEEVAEKTWQESFMCCSLSQSIDYVTVGEREKLAFIKGAKWQQERSYTLEQISELFIPIGKNGYIDDYLDYRLFNKEQPKLNFKKWFEKFKKK
jgi:hypothetical protein